MRRIALITLIVLAGLATMAYPTISNHLTLRHGSAAIQAYAATVAEMDEAALAAAWEAAEQYNQSLTGSPVHDPFLPGSGMAMADDYRQVLDFDGIMGYLDIPRIGVYLPIYHGTGDAVLQVGVGHLEGSTLPIGGTTRHTVLSGHTGLSHAKLLTDLVELAEGDQFYLHVLGRILAYAVDQITVVEPQDTAGLRRFEGKDYATLLTCTPYGVNSHRLLVRGERVEYRPEVREAVVPVSGSTTEAMARRAAAWTAGAMACLIVAVAILQRRRDRRLDARRSPR